MSRTLSIFFVILLAGIAHGIKDTRKMNRADAPAPAPASAPAPAPAPGTSSFSVNLFKAAEPASPSPSPLLPGCAATCNQQTTGPCQGANPDDNTCFEYDEDDGDCPVGTIFCGDAPFDSTLGNGDVLVEGCSDDCAPYTTGICQQANVFDNTCYVVDEDGMCPVGTIHCGPKPTADTYVPGAGACSAQCLKGTEGPCQHANIDDATCDNLNPRTRKCDSSLIYCPQVISNVQFLPADWNNGAGIRTPYFEKIEAFSFEVWVDIWQSYPDKYKTDVTKRGRQYMFDTRPGFGANLNSDETANGISMYVDGKWAELARMPYIPVDNHWHKVYVVLTTGYFSGPISFMMNNENKGFLGGKIRNIKVYQSKLRDEEIAALNKGIDPPVNKMLGSWSCTEGSGGQLASSWDDPVQGTGNATIMGAGSGYIWI